MEKDIAPLLAKLSPASLRHDRPRVADELAAKRLSSTCFADLIEKITIEDGLLDAVRSTDGSAQNEELMTRPGLETSFAAANFPRGVLLLRDPLLNKGTAFSEAERDAFGTPWLTAGACAAIEEQAAGIHGQPAPDALTIFERYVLLNALHDRNETLFFRVVCDDINAQFSH